jgi:GMP synthase-like glutamine amidotransferase
MSANDSLPGLAHEIEVIRSALARQTPVLGICLGSQLIAKALGARVYRNPYAEIGWAPVSFTEAARRDPVFADVPSPTTFFHWHNETFDLPEGAELLARSDRCRHQAYRYGRNVYGLQFHPEITPAMIEDWCAQPVNCGDVRALTEPIDAYATDPSSLAQLIFERWLSFL